MKRWREAVATAFEEPDAKDDARASAQSTLRARLVGEPGKFSKVGAEVLEHLLGLAAKDAAAQPARLFELALDLLFGALPIEARSIADRNEVRRGPGKATHAVALGVVPALRSLLRSERAASRAGAALVLGVIGAREASAELVAALGREDDDGARAAFLIALGALGAVADHAAYLAPEQHASVRLAAGIGAYVACGDQTAPELVLAIVPLLIEADAGPAFSLPSRLRTLALREWLAGTRAEPHATAALLMRIDSALSNRSPDSATLSRAIGELQLLIERHVPELPPEARLLTPTARKVLERTLHPALRNLPAHLPRTALERRRYLELPPPKTDPRAKLRAHEESFEDGGDMAARPSIAALLELGDSRWAEAFLARRGRWPGATRAPNGPITLAALLLLGRDDRERVDREWLRDHEPVLAALTCDDSRELVRELLSMLSRAWRVSALREHLDLYPNKRVAFLRALDLAPACPFDEVGIELLRRALVVEGGPSKLPLDDLAATLDALGPAGAAARSALTTLRSAVVK